MLNSVIDFITALLSRGAHHTTEFLAVNNNLLSCENYSQKDPVSD
jgi:hypothetical protein